MGAFSCFHFAQETSLFGYVVMSEVLALGFLKCLKRVSGHHGMAEDHVG